MNPSLVLAAVDGVLLLFLGGIAFLLLRMRLDLQSLRNNLSALEKELRGEIESLRLELAEIRKTTAAQEPTRSTWSPGPVITADQRAGAIGLLRKGADSETVASAVGISIAEAELLRRVHNFQAQ
ncbi:MAG TPA: hypothetical protein VHA14_09075 [Bryobacteraceae bacterium]|nr:hypothetical protein [Bryobacteraceae bacterium]